MDHMNCPVCDKPIDFGRLVRGEQKPGSCYMCGSTPYVPKPEDPAIKMKKGIQKIIGQKP